MDRAVFRIEGMYCGGCVETLKALLGAEAGVRAAEVSLERGEASVLYDPQAIDPQRLAAVIEKPGYRVAGFDA